MQADHIAGITRLVVHHACRVIGVFMEGDMAHRVAVLVPFSGQRFVAGDGEAAAGGIGHAAGRPSVEGMTGFSEAAGGQGDLAAAVEPRHREGGAGAAVCVEGQGVGILIQIGIVQRDFIFAENIREVFIIILAVPVFDVAAAVFVRLLARNMLEPVVA